MKPIFKYDPTKVHPMTASHIASQGYIPLPITGYEEPPTSGFPGTLRQWYAGLAMQSFLQTPELATLWSDPQIKGAVKNPDERFASWVKLAYSFSWWMADQMMREGKPDGMP